eukprot:9321875-Alexandrium_andersonii.AAC.1
MVAPAAFGARPSHPLAPFSIRAWPVDCCAGRAARHVETNWYSLCCTRCRAACVHRCVRAMQVAAFVSWHPLDPPMPHLATFHAGHGP